MDIKDSFRKYYKRQSNFNFFLGGTLLGFNSVFLAHNIATGMPWPFLVAGGFAIVASIIIIRLGYMYLKLMDNLK